MKANAILDTLRITLHMKTSLGFALRRRRAAGSSLYACHWNTRTVPAIPHALGVSFATADSRPGFREEQSPLARSSSSREQVATKCWVRVPGGADCRMP